MKKPIFTLALLLLALMGLSAQTTLVDFDGTAGTPGAWEGTTSIVTNPLKSGINTSDNVCVYTTPAGKSWGNCASIIFATTLEAASLDSIQIMVKAPSASKMYVKLESESSSNEPQPEAWATPSVSSDWQIVTLTFSGTDNADATGVAYDKLAIFFNVDDNTGGEDWYYDNIVAYGGGAEAKPIEPLAPTNLQYTNITDTSFTLTWDNDSNATSTNVFIEEPAVESGNLYIATVGAGVTSYTFAGTYNDKVTISGDGVYYTRVEALPDADWSAYAELAYNIAPPLGQELDYSDNFHIYLCFGQSNMEGSAAIETIDRSADERFQSLQSLDCDNLLKTSNLWYDAVPPLVQCYSGLSPADYFGRTMIEQLPDSIMVGVITVAIGGCDIRLFDKDIYADYDSTINESWFTDKVAAYGGNPYAHMINMAKKAQQSGVIKGILMHQGESNTGDEQWPSYVKKIYYDILAELSLTAESTPLLAGEVASEGQGGICSAMNPIINRLPDSIPTAYVIPSDDCTIQDDSLHFDSPGVRELGKRYAEQMLSLLGAPTSIDDNKTPAICHLIQNYPNPTSGLTNISFETLNANYVSLKVINMQGLEIAELAGKTYTAGKHTVQYNADHLPAGIYFYTLNVDNYTETLKLIKR